MTLRNLLPIRVKIRTFLLHLGVEMKGNTKWTMDLPQSGVEKQLDNPWN
jgi:hypothetical protein